MFIDIDIYIKQNYNTYISNERNGKKLRRPWEEALKKGSQKAQPSKIRASAEKQGF